MFLQKIGFESYSIGLYLFQNVLLPEEHYAIIIIIVEIYIL